jgi:hypothetical protein
MTDKRKRAAPTIDLAATEVSSAAAGSEAQPQPDAPPYESAAQPQPEPAPQPMPSEEPQAEPDALARRIGAGIYAAAIAAGFAGAALVTAVFAALWFGGLLPVPSSNSSAAQIAALQKQVNDLQNRPAAAADDQVVDALRQRLSKIESDIAKLPPGDKTVAERLAAADNAMKSLGVALIALNKRSDDIAAKAAQAQEHAAAAEKTVNDLRDSVQNAKREPSAAVDAAALDALQKRLVALEQSVAAAREQIAKTSATDTAARLALSAAALRDAVESGAPYQAELAQAKSLGADESALAPLAPFAADGMPDKAALAQELSALIPDMMKASGDASAPAGFLERLQANAGRLVRISPVNAPPGDNPSDVLARIEVEAAKADIDGALNDLGKLPDAARAPAQAWVTKAKARQQTLAAARRFASDAARDLGKR